MNPDDRARLRALADAATPGPWEEEDGNVYAYDTAGGVAYDCSTEDATFIADARTAVPELLDALDAAEAERDWNLESSRASKLRAIMTEAQVQRVRDLHHPWGDTLSGTRLCDACDQPWPCPTVRALDGD